MIRSIGSSLLAKAGTGSLSRKKDETRITKPEVPGKGAVGTAQRDLVQETNITPTAPGSEKIIRSAPGVESASLPGVAGMSVNQVPLVAGIGSPGGAPAGQPGGAAPSNQNAPASQPGQAGRQAVAGVSTGTPMGAVATVKANRAAEAARTAEAARASEMMPMGYEAPRSPNYSVGSFFPGIASLGGRVSAEGEGNVEIPKNFGQAIVASLSKPGSKGEAWGTSPAVTRSGVGSLSKPGATIKAIANKAAPAVQNVVNNISSALRSVTQAAKNTVSNLRSKLFGR